MSFPHILCHYRRVAIPAMLTLADLAIPSRTAIAVAGGQSMNRMDCRLTTPPADRMHALDVDTLKLREEVFDYARRRMNYEPAPLDASKTPEELARRVPPTITEAGLGGLPALKIFEEVLAPSCISVDNPGFLSFIPAAPTEAATLFDLIVSASSIYGGSWAEGAGAVYAENEVLTWLAKEAGLPAGAGGVFVQGGTLGNLSALVAARHTARVERERAGIPLPRRWAFACSAEAHSSLKAAARVMDVEIIPVPIGESGKMRGIDVEESVTDWDGVFAVVATAGTTNFGIVDDLRSVGEVAHKNKSWFHVDGAYGLAGMLAPSTRELFDGVELADSFIVDPHKWLFAPFDACALVYRNPLLAKAAHTQHAEYLDVLTETGDWNPSDYAYHLSRRPRGLPLWFSLATHGIGAYRDAVESNIQLARQIAGEIERRPGMSLVRQPELSNVVFTRDGWTANDYAVWSNNLLLRDIAFVVPSSHLGQPNTRFSIVNPQTTFEALVNILDTMENS